MFPSLQLQKLFQNSSNIFLLNIISASMDILQVLFEGSEMVLFLVIVVSREKKLTNIQYILIIPFRVSFQHFNLFAVSSLIYPDMNT